MSEQFTKVDNIIKAIRKINANAKVNISGSDLDTCTIEWLEETAEISKADIQAKIVEVQAEIEQEKQEAITKKASAQNKLKALGLTDAEIEAL